MADKYIKDLTETTTDLATGDSFIVEKADSSGTKITKLSNLWTSLVNKFVKNNLTTTGAGYALDARQGKALQDSITSLNSRLADSAYISNADLDSYTTPGFYSLAGGLTNNPDSQTWFSMIVIGPVGATKQIVIARNNAIYKRFYQSNSWSAWQKFTGTVI